MLPTLLVLVSIALVVCLALLIFGRSAPSARAPISAAAPGVAPVARGGPDPEVERRRREVDELKTTVAELRGELKQTRKRLHDQRTSDREGADLVKARADVERSASQQLEVVRSELAGALAEVGRLKGEAEAFRMRRPAPAPAPAHAPPAPVAPPPAPEPRRFRELSDTDREKMERLEHLANRERSRAQELSAEVRRLKGRTETQGRVYTVIKGEQDLLKDKFKALEKRLNRTLLERDLLRRAIRDLEKKSGLAADRTELTADEVAASDRSVEERAAAEAAEIARRTRPPESSEHADPASGPAAAAGEPVSAEESPLESAAAADAAGATAQHVEKAG
ncbi:MAG TPA: cell envelope biogenesis protein TolA [Myxococcaceae bacterium]|nr:cell envelope biogenesis protein TolA [Myxococcaceae bacterium]